MKHLKHMAIIPICLLSLLCLNTVWYYKADFYLEQAKRHYHLYNNWKLAKMLIRKGFYNAPNSAVHFDRAGFLYFEEYLKNRKKEDFFVGRKILNKAHKLNKWNKDPLFRAVLLEIAGNSTDKEYIKGAVQILGKVYARNPVIRKFLEMDKKGGENNFNN